LICSFGLSALRRGFQGRESVAQSDFYAAIFHVIAKPPDAPQQTPLSLTWIYN